MFRVVLVVTGKYNNCTESPQMVQSGCRYPVVVVALDDHDEVA